MSNKKEANSTCVICGQKYHLCVACERKKASWKPWKMFVDKENCYNIYKVLNDYSFNKITKDEARELLSKFDLSDLNSFKENVKEKINDILRVEKTVKTYKNRRKKQEENEQLKEVVVEELEDKNEVEEKQLDELTVEEPVVEEIQLDTELQF